MITVFDIAEFLEEELEISGSLARKITKPEPLAEATASTSFTFCNYKDPQKAQEAIKNSKAGTVICYRSHVFDTDKTFIIVKDPRPTFIRTINQFFAPKFLKPRVPHPTAVIDKEAKIGDGAYIGPNVVIGKVKIGARARIHANVVIQDNVVIGDDFIVQPNTTIGCSGFNYVDDGKGGLEKFHHFGRVVIGDRVEIGSATCVDRGVLGDTEIGDDTKIGNFVYVSHNTKIGKCCSITTYVIIGGSSTIGDRVWIAPGVATRDHNTIGSDSFIGLGAIVTKPVKDGETVVGNPARPLAEFKEILRKIKNL